MVAPPSIRLWILKEQIPAAGMRTYAAVAPPSIRLWILKATVTQYDVLRRSGCTPFDPLVDTERMKLVMAGLMMS